MEGLWVLFPVLFRPLSPAALEADSRSNNGIKQETEPADPESKINKHGYHGCEIFKGHVNLTTPHVQNKAFSDFIHL